MERRRLQTKAGLVNTFYADQTQTRGQQLAEALGVATQGANDFVKNKREAKEAEQAENIRFYAEKIRTENEGVQINKIQVQNLMPELSPTIAGRVASDIGFLDARDKTNAFAESINQDADLKNNRVRREAAIQEYRESLVEQAGDNAFYGQGLFSGSDRELLKWEAQWEQEQADYDTQVQQDAFYAKVTDSINSGDFTAIDAEYGATSSLSNVKRKSLIQKAFIDQAYATNDEDVLETLPKKYRNAQYEGQLNRHKVSIATNRYTEWTRKRQRESEERTQQFNVTRSKIIQEVLDGSISETLNGYINDPDAYEYAQKMIKQSLVKVDENQSYINRNRFENNLFTAGTTGNFDRAFAGNRLFIDAMTDPATGQISVTTQRVQEYVYSMEGISTQDRKELLEKIPKLMEGYNYVRDENITWGLSSINADIADYAKTLDSKINTIFESNNVSSKVTDAYWTSIRNQMQAYRDDNGDVLPNGSARMEMVEKARADAEIVFNKLKENLSLTGGSNSKTDRRGRPKPDNSRSDLEEQFTAKLKEMNAAPVQE